MPRPEPQRTDHALAAAADRRLTPEQIQHWAESIADGRDQFPVDLTPPDRDRLLTAVRRRRRDRLVLHVARAIALDLHRAEQRD